MTSLRLSVLDVSPIASGETARDALLATCALASHVEGLGYTRYWVAEHHNAAALACPAPEVLVATLLERTRTIRVGSGGVMLPNHAPLRIAEAFRVLSAFHPGRVDLGLGRAPGTDKRTAALLRRGSSDTFGDQLDALDALFCDEPMPRAPFATSVVAIPVGVPAPARWILGTSVESATFAAERGLGYAYAHHIAPEAAEDALLAYERSFVPSASLAAPAAILAVAAVVADDPEIARALERAAAVAGLRFARGERDLPMPTLDEARAHVFSEEDLALVAAYAGRAFVGETARVAPALRALAARCHVGELMILGNVAERALQRESHTRLAAALRA